MLKYRFNYDVMVINKVSISDKFCKQKIEVNLFLTKRRVK
jgi:hypothetical protein